MDIRTQPWKVLLDRVDQHGNLLRAMHGNATMHSAFQPIVSLGHCRTVGYEGLIRAADPGGIPIPPPALFQQQHDVADHVELDRLCRTLHVMNYRQSGHPETWLFLNIDPVTMVHGKDYGDFFAGLLEENGILPERIVIEILETKWTDPQQLANAADFYRRLGCLIAIDDFGAGHSNFQRVWQIKPHIVKFDRALISHAAEDAYARRTLPGMISLLHEAGCLVLIEGIENENEAMIAMESNADLAQGWFFGKPQTGFSGRFETAHLITGLHGQYQLNAARRNSNPSCSTARALLEQAASSLRSAGACTLENQPAINALLQYQHADRCYLVDEFGTQVGPTIAAPGRHYSNDRLFHPLEDSSGANWVRRNYHQAALQYPGRVHATRPYLSIATGKPCITLSIAIELAGAVYVVCYDIEHMENHS